MLKIKNKKKSWKHLECMTYNTQETVNWIIVNFSSENTKTKRQWKKIQLLRESNLTPESYINSSKNILPEWKKKKTVSDKGTLKNVSPIDLFKKKFCKFFKLKGDNQWEWKKNKRNGQHLGKYEQLYIPIHVL